jgi:hypothetical protein
VTGRYSNQLNYHTVWGIIFKCDAKIQGFFKSTRVLGNYFIPNP